MLFSIVVPIYNVDQYLDKCINSILSQNYRSFELILVDDGSTDSSPDICDKYKDADDRVIVIHKRNGGLVSARKAGITIAKGDYAVCVDGDDWIEQDYLQALSEVINQYRPSIICFKHYEVIENRCIERAIPYRTGYYSKDDLNNEIYPFLIQTSLGHSFPPTIWAKVYAMDLYRAEQLAVDDRIKIGEDAACSIPCMYAANNIYILDKALYYYRRNDKSMTKNRKAFPWDGPERIHYHLSQRIFTSETDMQEQICRRTVHALINVVKTQFYKDESYFTIVTDIKRQINRPIYREVIRRSHFSLVTPIGFFSICLRCKSFIPFYILSKIRR